VREIELVLAIIELVLYFRSAQARNKLPKHHSQPSTAAARTKPGNGKLRLCFSWNNKQSNIHTQAELNSFLRDGCLRMSAKTY